ncbi:MAG: tetratricopeptide repeat protein [bacterium]
MKAILLFVAAFLLTVRGVCSADQFEVAETYLKQRDFDRAAEEFLAFAGVQPDHEDAPAESCLEQEDSLQAATYYEKAVHIGEENFLPVSSASDAQFAALQRCGELYASLRQCDRAEPYYAKLLDRDIDDRRQMPEVYSELATCYEAEGKGAEAAETYLDLIRTYPTSPQARALCQTKEEIDPYATFNWEPYEYFVEGYTILRTWPARAAEHMINLESTLPSSRQTSGEL